MKLTLLAPLLITVACAPRVPPPQVERAGLTASDSIRLAVLTHLSARAHVRGDRVVCVAVASPTAGAQANREPTPIFMSALAARLPYVRVRPHSRCRRQTDPLAPYDAVTDSATGAPAIDRWVGTIQWEDSTRARVEAGFWCGELCAAGYRCDVERKGQGWAVTGCVTEWMSARPPSGNEEMTASFLTTSVRLQPTTVSLSTFGIAPYFDEPFYVGFNVGGFRLGLDPDVTNQTPGPGGAVAYWGVRDLAGALAGLIPRGVTVRSPLQDVGGGILVASIEDPFGNPIGLIENPHFAMPPAS